MPGLAASSLHKRANGIYVFSRVGLERGQPTGDLVELVFVAHYIVRQTFRHTHTHSST
jgi:hypothetical protein